MGYRCRTCGVWHDERPTCFVSELPAVLAALSQEEFAARVKRSSDQCALDGEHFFILGNLDVRTRGTDEFMRWTVWTTLSRANFERASELWNVAGRESEPPYFGWLSNQIPGFPPSVNIKALVHTQPVGTRPQIEIIEPGHQLGIEQKVGITAERADELIHVALHRAGEPGVAAGAVASRRRTLLAHSLVANLVGILVGVGVAWALHPKAGPFGSLVNVGELVFGGIVGLILSGFYTAVLCIRKE